MVELIGMHCFQEAYIVYDFFKIRQAVGDKSAAVAVLVEVKLWPQHPRHALDKGKALSFK